MLTRLVVACCGDLGSFETIAHESARAGTEVIAVALDLGNGESLSGLKEAALAAGAARCHAIDLREEFARDVIVPAAREAASTGTTTDRVLAKLGPAFVSRAVQSIAMLEEGQPVFSESISFHGDTRAKRHASGSALIALQFEAGLPTAINGVRMTLPEVIESIETISACHAPEVLSLAYGELGMAGGDSVTMWVQDGRCTISPAASLQS
jgi:argininosuccinate synthase